jgi:hypothetical protein
VEAGGWKRFPIWIVAVAAAAAAVVDEKQTLQRGSAVAGLVRSIVAGYSRTARNHRMHFVGVAGWAAAAAAGQRRLRREYSVESVLHQTTRQVVERHQRQMERVWQLT